MSHEEDILVRDLLISSSIHMTEEQMKELEQDAPWMEITEDGIIYSKGMAELIRYTFGEKEFDIETGELKPVGVAPVRDAYFNFDKDKDELNTTL